MTKFCPNCGNQSTEGRFCMHCGAKRPDATQNGSASTSFTSQNPSLVNDIRASAPSLKNAGHVASVAASFTQKPPPANAYPYKEPDKFSGYAAPAKAAINSFRNSNDSFSTSKNLNNAVIPTAIPPAATGVEAQRCYEECVSAIRNCRPGQENEHGVKAFKKNCKNYGLGLMGVSNFHASIVRELGPQETIAFVPNLARLVPDEVRRRELVQYNDQAAGQTAVGSYQEKSFAPATAPSFSRASSYNGSNSALVPRNQSGSSKGVLKNRYADHPNCDICRIGFDVTKRRHQCRHCGQYICSNCSPARFLIPPGKQIPDAKGYEPSIPQRVCIQCAPEIQTHQDELVRTYAASNSDNLHEARGRFHAPYSSSLMKECQNAADIIGNFFRDEWGTSADRSIPIAFLEKAHGLALMTIIKAGFLVTGKIGTGLVIAKLPNGSWSAPSAIGTIGFGGGLEIGGEIVEVMIILGSEKAVKIFHKAQINLGAGLDIAVGPFGRSAEAAAAANSGGLNTNYSYSLSKGLYAGISLQGAVIATRSDLNRKFYGRELQSQEILSGFVEQPNAAAPLYEALHKAMQGVQAHREVIAMRTSMMGPCRLCNCPSFVAHTHQVWNKSCKVCKHVH